jgi:four helix bundle protein
VERFEDLIAWQKARDLAQLIYQVTRQDAFRTDFGLRDQIRRASVSIASNIAEGFDRGSRADFHRFLTIAKGSCAELRCQLYIATDAGYFDKDTCQQLMSVAEEVARILGGLRTSVAKQRDEQREKRPEGLSP